jgi:ATP-dependent DNA helicase PIF1
MKSIDPELEKIPFGGKTFLFGGDFRQLLPIVPHANRAIIIQNCLSRSVLWRSIRKLKLSINMRLTQLNDQDVARQNEFANYLLRVGEGKIDNITELGTQI